MGGDRGRSVPPVELASVSSSCSAIDSRLSLLLTPPLAVAPTPVPGPPAANTLPRNAFKASSTPARVLNAPPPIVLAAMLARPNSPLAVVESIIERKSLMLSESSGASGKNRFVSLSSAMERACCRARKEEEEEEERP